MIKFIINDGMALMNISLFNLYLFIINNICIMKIHITDIHLQLHKGNYNKIILQTYR